MAASSDRYGIFFKRPHRTHRLVGLAYLVHWVDMLRLLCTQPSEWWDTPLGALRLVALPCHGLAQTCVAIRTFTFLSRDGKQNYFSDRGTVSMDFLKENAFFVLLTVYAATQAAAALRVHTPWPVELVCSVLPYVVLRPLFPKTSFLRRRERDQSAHPHDRTTAHASALMAGAALATKLGFLVGKHYVGYMINYAFFLRGATAEERGLMRWILLGGAYNLTIGVFVHTLKFKRVISPGAAIAAYVPPFVIWAIPAARLGCAVAYQHPWLACAATAGFALNFRSRPEQDAYQLALAAALVAARS